MTTSDTDEKLETTAVQNEEPVLTSDPQDQTVTDSPSAEAAPAPSSSGEESQESTPDIAVTHIGPEFVEPTPPKELRLPDTAEIRRILQLQVPMIVRLAHKIMPLGEILQLAPGAIIEFSKSVGEDLDLMINNKCIGTGQAVKVGEKFGMKVTNVTTLEQMIRAMADNK